MTSGMGNGATVNIPWDSLGCSPAKTAMGLDGVSAAGHRPHRQATRTEVHTGEALHPSHHAWSPAHGACGPLWTRAEELKTSLTPGGETDSVQPVTPSASSHVAVTGHVGAKPSA